jgi:uracil phosphoribosyltransferase
MNRTTNESMQVTGAGMYGKKIAGPVKDRILVFPDPMGATGGSLSEAIRFYLKELDGAPKHVYALNLIVTPEFIRRMTDEFPGKVSIYAYRLDRGLSPDSVLQALPGEHWDLEKGLTDHQYIVPGAGGMGEIMNNALS